MLEQVLTTFRPQAESRRLTLTSHLPPAPLWMEADPTRLEQVFTNLLDNAAKYTDVGGTILVSIEGGQTRQGHPGARVRVRDTGIGIRPDILPLVFDLFAQADETLERTRGGLGIGLTLVRNLVEMHGGQVEAHSAGAGQGSEFQVWLPLLSDAVDEARDVVLPDMVKRRRHVLLVEDNDDARQALQELMETWGHRVEGPESGPRGLELAAQHAPELALVDIGLPGLDGYRVAEQLRARMGPGIRLVALTGYGRMDDEEPGAGGGLRFAPGQARAARRAQPAPVGALAHSSFGLCLSLGNRGGSGAGAGDKDARTCASSSGLTGLVRRTSKPAWSARCRASYVP